MKSNKRINCLFILFSIIFMVVVLIFVGYTVSEENKFNYEITDTLENGNGKHATVILLGGQSNASGCTLDEYLKKNVNDEQYNEYQNGYDNVYINYFSSGNNVSNGFVKCKSNQGETNGYFGPELGMAEKLHELYPNELFFIIKWAWGGTNLYDQWLSPSSYGPTGKLYNHFVGFVESSLKYLLSKDYNIKIEGFCWMQGESDSFSTDHATKYERHLNNLIYDIRNKFNKVASKDGIALIDAMIADNPNFWVYCDLVNKSKQKVADSSPINVVIDTNKYGLTCLYEPTNNPDQAHYDSMSQIKLGHLFIEYLVEFIDK